MTDTRQALAFTLAGHIKTLRASGRNDGLVEDMERARAALSAQPVAGAVAEPRTLLEQFDLDQSADYRKGYEDGRLKGYEVGHRHATEQAQAAPAPEPSAQGEPVTLTEHQKTAPRRIWLNIFADEDLPFPSDHEGITWCEDEVGDFDVPYVRADLASAPSTPPHAVVEAVPLTDEQADALRRLWPAIEKAMGCLVFTAERAGAVQADMNTVRRGIATKAAQEPKA